MVESNSTLAAVIEAMQREDRGTVLVVEARKLVGIFTERDVLMKVAGHAIDLTRSQVSAFMTDGGFRMRSQQIFRCTKTFFPPNSRPNSGRFLPFGSERVCESDSLRHSVSISTFSLPAFTKKRAFAGQSSDLWAPELALGSPHWADNCAPFSVRKWHGALSIVIWNIRARPFSRQANLSRCVRRLSSHLCPARNGLIDVFQDWLRVGNRAMCVTVRAGGRAVMKRHILGIDHEKTYRRNRQPR